MNNEIISLIITIAIAAFVLVVLSTIVFLQYRKILREAKNYERGLKMIPMYIHIPPAGEDIQGNGRDERDVLDEVLSQSQVMYDIISSTLQKGFKSKVYGQRHLSFEIIAQNGLIHYYAVVPAVMTELVRQALASAYPTARLDEVVDRNIFSQTGKISGTAGGEFTLKKEFAYPIATYKESKRDVSRAILNSLSSITKDDGVAIQLMFRPADPGWTKAAQEEAGRIKKDKGEKKTSFISMFTPKELMGVLWKPPEAKEVKVEDKQLTAIEQGTVDAIEEKTRYAGYETLIRVIVSSNMAERSQALLKNIVASFALFDSTSNNGFKFAPAKDIEELVTAYIFRFFPQSINQNILNSVELATIFHLPDQDNIPTAQVEREMSKQVDGPSQLVEDGLLIGYNEFRGVRKDIRLSIDDRRRHLYFIGSTGSGKSTLLENCMYQDMLDGRGFAYVDPHGDSAEKLMGMVPKERVEDVIYFDPGDMANPIGLNMFEFDTPDQKDFLIAEAISMLYNLYDQNHVGIVGPRLEHIFRNCALLLMSDPAHPGTFIDIPKVLVDEDFRNSKLKYVTDQMVLDFWTKEFPASQRSNEAGEIITWVVAKFGPFMSNTAMRNIIGQEKSGFDLRQIMDNKKILLVNLSKGRMGDLNSKLLGTIFIMKFEAASLGRANIPEDERVDFTLYVDEFQNFSTESFATILAESRKYRLSLILANQFMTQLTDEVREAVIGNVGTVLSGRLGITDAEVLEKKFAPTYDAEDLTKLPNFETVTSVLINGVPSSPFSMHVLPPLKDFKPQLQDAMKKLSSAKYGRPRAEVEKEIFDRLGTAAIEKAKADAVKQEATASSSGSGQSMGDGQTSTATGTSFLDEWLAKRKQTAKTTTNSQSDNTAPPIIENSAVNQVNQVAPEPVLPNPVIRQPSNSKNNPAVEPIKQADDNILNRDSEDEVSVHIR